VASVDEIAPPEDLASFDAVVLGMRGALEERTERCLQLRQRGYAGVVVATYVDATEGEALLDAGADDFVTAAFEPRELITRVRASIRRAASHPRLRWGPLELDRVHRDLSLHGRAIALTAR